ncbi:MAG: YgjV family protein [Thalassotalea sp.]
MVNEILADLPENFFAQLIGLFSFALGAACFLQKDDKRFKYFHILLNVNHTLHFYLMDAMTSVIATTVSILRTAASIKISSKYAALFFIVVMLGVAYSWVEQWYHWLAVIAGCFGTYGLFCLKGIAMRVMLTFGCLCWLTSNIIIGSIGGIMLELLVLVTNLSTMYRLYRDGKTAQHDKILLDMGNSR